MADPILVSNRVAIPADAIETHAVRASGPGGQNVNKVSTKVEIYVDLEAIVGLSPPQRRRLTALTSGRVDADGTLRITSQRSRSRQTNLEDARDKIRELVAQALPTPKRRIATKPSKGARVRRRTNKQKHAEKKTRRRWSPE